MFLLNQRHIIIGEALIFSPSMTGVWGPIINMDVLFDYFVPTLEELSLHDIEPMKVNLTWRDMRSSKGRIAKCLSHIFSERLYIK